MANFKKYVLPYATNYEVNSNGDAHVHYAGRMCSKWRGVRRNNA